MPKQTATFSKRHTKQERKIFIKKKKKSVKENKGQDYFTFNDEKNREICFIIIMRHRQQILDWQLCNFFP